MIHKFYVVHVDNRRKIFIVGYHKAIIDINEIIFKYVSQACTSKVYVLIVICCSLCMYYCIYWAIVFFFKDDILSK